MCGRGGVGVCACVFVGEKERSGMLKVTSMTEIAAQSGTQSWSPKPPYPESCSDAKRSLGHVRLFAPTQNNLSRHFLLLAGMILDQQPNQ